MNVANHRPLDGARVLVVGSTLVRLPGLSKRLLEQGARRVDLAQALDVALGSCACGPIDVAVLPGRLGQLSGHTLARVLRSVAPNLAVLFVQEDAPGASTPGDVVLKAPATTQDVVRALRRMRREAA